MNSKIINKFFGVMALLILIIGAVKLYSRFNLEVIKKENKAPNLEITIYSKAGCSYCIMAKRLLDKNGIDYEFIELGENKDLYLKLVNQTGQSTVPYVFINDKFVGGYKDLKIELDKL